MPTVANLKESIRGVLTGININNVIDLDGKMQRAATTLLMKADVAEMTDRQALYLYDGVYDYEPDSTMFGGAILDVRPQGVSRSPIDYSQKANIVDFDMGKMTLRNGVAITFEQRGITKVMRLAQTKAFPRVLIDSMSDDDDWTAAGDASGLAEDTTVYYDNPASLRFNLAANGLSGYIQKTLTSQLDLTSYEGVGVVFLAVSLPSATAITSINLRLGNSSANYWSVTATEGFLGAWIANDFLLVALDLALATTTGTVDETAIDYVRLTFAYSSTSILANVRVGGLWVALPSPYEVIFETPAIFVASATTTRSKTISAPTDSILLEEAAYQIYVYECAREIALGKGGTIASGVILAIDQVLEGDGPGGKKLGLYQKYRGDNPAQQLRTVGSYYSIR